MPSVLALLPSLLLLPILARQCTTAQWAAIAVGQSVGTVAAIAVNLGWSLNGPARVSALDKDCRVRIYGDSLASRLIAFAVVGPISAVVSLSLIPSEDQLLGSAMCVAVAVSGLSPAWFNIGVGAARDMIRYDVVPAALATSLSAVGLLVGMPVGYFPVLAGLGTLLGVVLFSARLASGWPLGRFRVDLGVLKSQVVAAVTEVSGAGYSAANVALVGSQAQVPALAVYASGMKLYLFALMAVGILSQALQGWVSEDLHRVGDRMRTALLTHLSLGLAGAVTFVVIGPAFTRVFFSESLAIGRDLAAAFGAAYLAVSLNTTMGRHILVPNGRERTVLHSTLFGAVLGIPTTLVLAAFYGAVGGAVALAMSEIAVCLWQLPVCASVLRGHPCHQLDESSNRGNWGNA